MERIATNGATKDIIRKHNFPVKKSYGQNFLVNAHTLNKIVQAADITKGDLVIEVGPGLGGLTQVLCEAAGRVAAIEIDAKLMPILRETLAPYDNLELIHADALNVDFAAIVGETPREHAKVVANLPYYVTTPIIMGLLEKRIPICSIIVMVQKEVAARMAARPSTKDYGSLSLAVAYYSEPYLVANVPRNCFMPRPGVDSAVIQLNVRPKPAFEVEDEPMLFSVIKSAFSMRRKTLQNCLLGCENLNPSKDDIKEALVRCGLGEQARGEALSLEDFVKLTEALKDIVS